MCVCVNFSVQSPDSPSVSPRVSGSEVVEFVDPPEEFDITLDPGARTALHLAIAHSHTKVVDILLNHKGK